MPITQLQDQSGLGSLVGMVGGYLLGNPARKAAQKQQEVTNARNKTNDDRANAAAKDTHDNITSEIATRNAAGARTAADDTNTKFQQGAYTNLLTQLHTPPPAGTTAQQWVSHIQSQVPTLGLTDPKMLGDLYAEAQGVLSKDQAASATKFTAGEHALPSDPTKRLSTLMKRLQIERGTPGVDTKPTETMIADTQKQITEAQAAAHQNTVDKRQQSADAENKRHHLADENKPHEGRTASAQEQYFLKHGYMPPTYSEANPKAKEKKVSVPEQRSADANVAGAAISKGGDRDKIVKHYAAKWNISTDKASDELPDE